MSNYYIFFFFLMFADESWTQVLFKAEQNTSIVKVNTTLLNQLHSRDVLLCDTITLKWLS